MWKIHGLPAAATKQKRQRSKIIFLFKQSKDVKQSAAKFLNEFLDASPQRHTNASCFTHFKHEALKRVFIKKNSLVLQLKECFRLENTF